MKILFNPKLRRTKHRGKEFRSKQNLSLSCQIYNNYSNYDRGYILFRTLIVRETSTE
jgi:hypothetical protein